MADTRRMESPRDRRQVQRQNLKHTRQETDDEVLRQLFASDDLFEFLEYGSDLVGIINPASRSVASKQALNFAFCNQSLRSSQGLLELLKGKHRIQADDTVGTNAAKDFKEWIACQWETNAVKHGGSYIYAEVLWTASVLKERWLLLRGITLPSANNIKLPSAHRSRVPPKQGQIETPDQSESPKSIEKIQPFFEDVTLDDGTESSQERPEAGNAAPEMTAHSKMLSDSNDLLSEYPWWFPVEPLTAHQRFVRDFDWASTPLGPIGRWPSQLRETCTLVLTNPEPAAVFWGDAMAAVYNEAFITIAGQKHPNLMGKDPAGPFAEVWDEFFAGPILQSRQTKQAFSEEGMCLLLERLGYPEETFVTFTFLPLLDAEGNVVAFYHTVLEVTRQVLGRRRMTMLLKLSERTATASDLKSFWNLIVECLDENELDVPFAVLYSISDEIEDDPEQPNSPRSSSRGSFLSKQCVLEGSLGFPETHGALFDRMSLDDSARGFAPAFRAALNTRRPTVLSTEDGTLSQVLIQGLERRGFSEICNTIVVCPLQPTTHENVLGFLAVGLSCRRPYDKDYRLFIDLLTGHLRSSLASVVLLVDEQRRGRSAAEEALYQQTQLLMKLQERARENELMDRRYKNLAERAPVGIFDFDLNGEILFCNTTWYELTQQSREQSAAMSWMNAVVEEDVPLVADKWWNLSRDLNPTSFEIRLKRPWRATDNADESARLDCTWVLAAAYPVMAEDGSFTGVTGTLTDISSQKWSVALQTQRVNDMIESKRQQENFVDMTSHEMRNPLNAMLLCAEDLYVTLDRLQSLETTKNLSAAPIIRNCIDSAETILYCGRHQKRIIDDILTLSKLDAKLLNITPIAVQPVAIVQDALKLFESELRAQDIEMTLSIESTYKELAVESVFMDPSRVVQILVNFIANAVKYTKGEKIRKMTVSLGASTEKPSTLGTNIKLVSSGRQYHDPTTSTEWGDGDPLYLHFGVHDTGPGLSAEEMEILFGRFAQNVPRTHAHYGGSGLGLFISQQLAELQAGEVGFSSRVNQGSSFIFYVKTRRHTSTTQSPKSGMATNDDDRKRKRHTTGIKSNGALHPKEGPASSQANVLIVEDNLVNQKVLCKQLQKMGYKISVANHGEEALSAIRKSKFWNGCENTGEALDIVLMDIEMPVMDGRVAIRRIRELQRAGSITGHIPVVAVTANARQEQIDGAMGHGFDEVVSKPYRITELVSQIERLVG